MARARGVKLDVLVVLATESAGATAVNASGRVQPARVRVCTGMTDDREHRVKHRDVDPLAQAGALTGDQRHDDACRAQKRAEVGWQGDRRIERPRPIPAGRLLAGAWDAVVSRGVEDPLPGLHAGARIIRRETGDRTVDEARVALRRAFGAQSEAVHHPWSEVLDEHIGAVHEASRRLSLRCRLQVKRDAAFAALEKGIGIRIPGWTVRRIDMDDVGTLIRKHDRGQRSSKVVAEVNDAETV